MKATEIRLIKGRLKYNDGDSAAPFPSAIVVWGTPTTPVLTYVEQTWNSPTGGITLKHFQ